MQINQSKYLSTLLLLMVLQAQAMSDATQAVVVTTTSGLINAGTAIYMQGQGMNPQFVTYPNGASTVVPGNSSTQSPANNYADQNQQSQKQNFFNGD